MCVRVKYMCVRVKYMCVRVKYTFVRVSIVSLSMNLLLDCGTGWYFFSSSAIGDYHKLSCGFVSRMCHGVLLQSKRSPFEQRTCGLIRQVNS